ncbi:MAG TPA: TonB-dependent receptor, partial [Pseudomonadaceae bacterium]|nr:TonB-dependent receptor [Pseudomonadaceae bacterium]
MPTTTTAVLSLPARKGLLKPLAAAMLCAGYGTLACAQTASTQDASERERAPDRRLEVVEVHGEYLRQTSSSEKFTAPLLDTPQTLQIIPQEVFIQQGAQNLTDVLSNTPGISFNAGENGFSTSTGNFSLRGFDTSGSIFIDGSRDSGSYNRDIFNVEQVEVAKGPAGDNGRGSGGGYINMATKTPKQDNTSVASLSYGFDSYDSDPRQRGTVDINRAVTDHTAVRLNLMVEESGFAGRDKADRSAWGIAPSVAFGLGTPTRFTLAYQHVTDEGRPDWGVPASLIKDSFRYDPTTRSSLRDEFYGLSSDFQDIESNAFLLRAEHDLNSVMTLSNQTRWSRTDHRARFTTPFNYDEATHIATTQTQFYDRETTTVSNLTNLGVQFNTGAINHHLATGIEFTREESDAGRFGTSNSTTDIFNPNPDRAPATPFDPPQNNAVNVDTLAAYVYDTVEFNDNWQLTGGLRVEHYEVSIDSGTIDGAPTGSLAGHEDSETTVSGKIGLVYKPSENGSIYAAVGLA